MKPQENAHLGALVLFGLDRRSRGEGSSGLWVSLYVDGRRPPVRSASAPVTSSPDASRPIDQDAAREWSKADVAQERVLARREAAAAAGARPAASPPAPTPPNPTVAAHVSARPDGAGAPVPDVGAADEEPQGAGGGATQAPSTALPAWAVPAPAAEPPDSIADEPAEGASALELDVPDGGAPVLPPQPPITEASHSAPAAEAQGLPHGRERRVAILGGEGDPERAFLEEFLVEVGLEPVPYGDALLYAASGASPVWTSVDHAFSAGQAVIAWMKGETPTAAVTPFTTAPAAAPLPSPFADDESEPGFDGPVAAPAADSSPWAAAAFAGCVALGRHPNRTLLVVPQFSAPPDGIPERYLLRWDESRAARDLITARLRSAGCAARIPESDAPASTSVASLDNPVARAALALGLVAAGRAAPAPQAAAACDLARQLGWSLDPGEGAGGTDAMEALGSAVAGRLGGAAAAAFRLGVLVADAGGGRPSGLRHAANAEMVRLVRDLGGGPAMTGNLVRLLAKVGAGMWTPDVCTAVLERLGEYLAAYGTAEPSLPYLSLFFDRPLPADEGGVWAALRQIDGQVHLVRPALPTVEGGWPVQSA